MKIVYIVLSIAYLLLAVSYPLTNTLPTMFVAVLMCLTLSICFFNEFLRVRIKELENRTQ